VPRAGIEPARLAALDFESSASTSSAISATHEKNYDRVLRLLQALGLNCCYILWLLSSNRLFCLFLQQCYFLAFSFVFLFYQLLTQLLAQLLDLFLFDFSVKRKELIFIRRTLAFPNHFPIAWKIFIDWTFCFALKTAIALGE
jgi:hypothetical protein